MILHRDIIKIAEIQGVPKSTVDKDWVLGHFIDALFSIEELRTVLIFKGGTALRKCWFENYRFSEDLDFTCINPDFVLTGEHLKAVCELLWNCIELPTHIESLRELRHKDSKMGYEANIRFWGADHSRNENPPVAERWQTKIKIEITTHELMVFQPVQKVISHPYPDSLSADAQVTCYSLEEVVAEKLRALIQRSYTAPRDFYDLWYILSKYPGLNTVVIRQAFLDKLAFKGYAFTGIEQLVNPGNSKTVSKAWSASIGHQIRKSDLPTFEEVSTFLQGRIAEILVR